MGGNSRVSLLFQESIFYKFQENASLLNEHEYQNRWGWIKTEHNSLISRFNLFRQDIIVRRSFMNVSKKMTKKQLPIIDRTNDQIHTVQ